MQAETKTALCLQLAAMLDDAADGQWSEANGTPIQVMMYFAPGFLADLAKVTGRIEQPSLEIKAQMLVDDEPYALVDDVKKLRSYARDELDIELPLSQAKDLIWRAAGRS